MNMYVFDSKIEYLGDFASAWSTDVIKNEPMLFNCDADAAYNLGGVITKAFLTALPREWQSGIVVDSRVHMLMKGWFPCIPGYHHDDVPRPNGGQPDYDNPAYHSEHIMGLVNGDICPTKFALGKHELPKIENDIIYKRWHPIVEDQISSGILTEFEVHSGKLVWFDAHSMHTGQRAKDNGWRWFIRVSRNTDRVKQCTNEIRRQVQVYLEFPMEGW